MLVQYWVRIKTFDCWMLDDRKCPDCGKRWNSRLFIRYKSRYIYWIFRWVTWREYLATCGDCGKTSTINKNEGLDFWKFPDIPLYEKYSFLGIALPILTIISLVVLDTFGMV